MTAASRAGEHTVVDTTAGPVRGLWRGDSAAFLGIPFAEPPFGERRFLEPQPRGAWSGVRDAVSYGPTPQRRPLAAITTIPEPSIPGEDILNLNVFTPCPSADGELRPVLFYLHGGGYVAGSPASPWYDGASFNRDGVVVVTVAYRLGFEGFGWLPDAPVNRGVLDWLLALRWVRDNIAQFGGDPRRVTLAGQSAGGGSVLTLLTTERARGLFSRAISLSGAPSDLHLADAQQTSHEVAARLGVPASRSGFSSVPETALIAAQGGGFRPLKQPTADQLIEVMRGMAGGRLMGPVVDGSLLRWSVAEGVRAGAGSDIPLLIGATRDEFSALAHRFRHLFDGCDAVRLLDRLGVPPAVARRFAGSLPGRHPAEVAGQWLSDMVIRRRVVDLVDLRNPGAATWVYDFAWRSAVSGLAEHCLDVPFVFGLLDDPEVVRVAGPAVPQQLADLVHRAFVRFIHGDDPGWPPYASSRSVMVFDTASAVVDGGYASARTLPAR
ncbi:carboxylesterase/lipase family protein [Streptomyces blattellae]|uniref:carboxylesterase/lipase family protein n=1 Tax=Streptomyces blattellae TaxID=2569855 RepID=UPI0012BA231F|nr:carboxylesterase family protein [Streptomyces blattellae]